MTGTEPAVGRPTATQVRGRSFHPWSHRRAVLSAVVLVAVLGGAGFVARRESLHPLELWTQAEQCSSLPKDDTAHLWGLADSTDLRGVADITVLRVRTITATGSAAPRYWVVPVTDGSGGTGSADVAHPPPHWRERVKADGAVLRRSDPVNLLVEVFPRDGHALLTGLEVVYRTPDGFVHTDVEQTVDEVDTSGRCARSTGQLP